MTCLICVTLLGAEVPAKGRRVSCLGQICAGERTLHVSGPFSLQGPCIVEELYVKRGDHVTKNQVLAKLHNSQIAEAQLQQAEAEVRVAAALLAQVKAGEKPAIIAAQETVVLRLEAELKTAELFYQRDRELAPLKGVSENDLERAQLNWRVAQKNFAQATNQLSAIKEVRKVDVQAAEAKLASAKTAVVRAKAELEQTIIRAPLDGVVLEILTYPGEMLNRDPLLFLGDVARMQVVAEVDVTDIQYVRTNATVSIQGQGFPSVLKGTIAEIGQHVDRSSILDPDPSAQADRRIVKVRVKLENPAVVQGLANHQVNVVITP